jgi:hypothetical protein
MSVHLYLKYSLDKRLGGPYSGSESFRVDKKTGNVRINETLMRVRVTIYAVEKQ